MRPFLKWAGGKYQIIDRIKNNLPSGARLIEPFLGSGAVFLNTNYAKYTLADSNFDLINVFKQLKKGKEEFINFCEQFFKPKHNQEDVFLKHREVFNTTSDHYLKAALFIYLNRHTFNGLMRYNSQGKFNVSFGRYKNPFFPKESMLFCVNKLKQAKLVCADFTKTMSAAQPGDVVYCDPPYLPLSDTAKFTQYNADGFTLQHQKKLSELAKELSQRGVNVIISNHATKVTLELYQHATIHTFEVQRFISCVGNKRNKAKELLAVF